MVNFSLTPAECPAVHTVVDKHQTVASDTTGKIGNGIEIVFNTARDNLKCFVLKPKNENELIAAAFFDKLFIGDLEFGEEFGEELGEPEGEGNGGGPVTFITVLKDDSMVEIIDFTSVFTFLDGNFKVLPGTKIGSIACIEPKGKTINAFTFKNALGVWEISYQINQTDKQGVKIGTKTLVDCDIHITEPIQTSIPVIKGSRNFKKIIIRAKYGGTGDSAELSTICVNQKSLAKSLEECVCP